MKRAKRWPARPRPMVFKLWRPTLAEIAMREQFEALHRAIVRATAEAFLPIRAGRSPAPHL